ncbi:MAG: hypothetical protein RR389_08350, partial [Christensenella sp.]
MSIENAKFTSTEFTGKDIASLPDNPSAEGISTAELKARFDNVGKMMVALGKHNALIDALTSSVAGDSGAKGIGVEAIAGVAGVDVQAALIGLKALLDKEKSKTDAHALNAENPHSVTKVQVGLSNVDNTSDVSKPVSAAQAAAIDERIPKTDISQVLGATSTKIPSEKAVTDAMASAGYGDMLKAVYDAGGSGVVDDAEKLGGQLPAYYAKKTEVDAAQGTADAAAKITDLMCVGGRSYRNDANNIPNGVTYCNTNTPNGRECYVWQIEYSSTDKEQLAFPVASAFGVAYRSFGRGAWATWTEMMSKTGGTFSGSIAAPKLVSGAVETDTYFHILANEGLRV